EHVDGIAVLAGAAGAVADGLDAVVGHDGAVVARLRAPDLDAVVAGAADGVARDQEARCVQRMDRDLDRVIQRAAADLAAGCAARDAGAAGADHLAAGDAHALRALELNEPAPLGEPPP